MRLQAVIRSRILSHRFKHLRGHIIRLQARSRGYLIRREMTRKKWAVIKIQSNVRRMIAQRDYRRMRVERRARYVFTEKNDLKLREKLQHCRFRFIYVVHKLVSRFMVDGQSCCFLASTSIESCCFFIAQSGLSSVFLKETHLTQKIM